MAPHFQEAMGTKDFTQSYTRILPTKNRDIVFTIYGIEVFEECAFARTTAEGTKFWVQKRTQGGHRNREFSIFRKKEAEWKLDRYCLAV